ncbi:hypothetical protein N7513_009316 [Penicillium frequentans]|nr:hypothetical protein N7513_009316 [Penicillium glabrum]
MEVSFRCQQPGCTRSYLRKEHLRRHERDHANARPFTCQECPSAFNRRDLLNRHKALNHGDSQRLADKPHPEGSAASKRSKPTDDHSPTPVGEYAAHEAPSSNTASEIWHLDLSSTPAAKLLEATNRRQLEELYFRNFHPHWPILHQQTFQNSAQPPNLSIAVLIAGLWMIGTPETRNEAMSYHDAILTELNRKLFEASVKDYHPKVPVPEFLAEFQALLILIILSTYRGADFCPPGVICHKELFELFDRYGVYDQKKIDMATSNPIHREVYQRLALVHFKVHIHLNYVMVTDYSKFKPLGFFDPQMLQVRAPAPSHIWDNSFIGWSDYEVRTVVGSLFENTADSSRWNELSSVLAWDFTLGMALGCCLASPAEETYPALLQRIGPFLFSHLKDTRIADPGRTSNVEVMI